MKKLLSLVILIALLILALPTAALAADLPAFNFDNLLTEEGSAYVERPSGNLNSTLTNGFWFAAYDSSSLDGILSTTTLNGIPVFLLDSPTASTYIWPAAQASERDKILKLVASNDNGWYSYDPHFILPASQPIRRTVGSDIIGYTGNLLFSKPYNKSYSQMQVYVSDDNTVYPIILSVSDLNSNPAVVWKENWPKSNDELTTILRDTLGTTADYTYSITPTFGGKKSTNLLYLPITAIAGEGGSITESGEKLFRPGDISQKYTVTANEGYTIYYIQVDGKTVSNSINCGDEASFTFDAIYGPRSINAVFKKK